MVRDGVITRGGAPIFGRFVGQRFADVTKAYGRKCEWKELG